jgi:hypothetical protein
MWRELGKTAIWEMMYQNLAHQELCSCRDSFFRNEHATITLLVPPHLFAAIMGLPEAIRELPEGRGFVDTKQHDTAVDSSCNPSRAKRQRAKVKRSLQRKSEFA